MAQLAEAYFHFRPYDTGEGGLQTLGESIERSAIEVARQIYGGGVEIEILLEEGSIKGWIKVIGKIIAVGGSIYIGVANVKPFYEGIDILCGKAHDFAVNVCGAAVKKAKVPPQHIYRIEKRKKTPGKIQRLSQILHELEDKGPHLAPERRKLLLARARRLWKAIELDLAQEEQRLLKKQLNLDHVPGPNLRARTGQAGFSDLIKLAGRQLVVGEDADYRTSVLRPRFEVTLERNQYYRRVFVPVSE
jgi:hypothetical protein